MRVIKVEPKQLRTPAQKRKDKALQIFQSGSVACLNDCGTEFKVKSQDDKEPGWYHVSFDLETNCRIATCTCYDYAYNNVVCKHVIASKLARHEMGYAIL